MGIYTNAHKQDDTHVLSSQIKIVTSAEWRIKLFTNAKIAYFSLFIDAEVNTCFNQYHI